MTCPPEHGPYYACGACRPCYDRARRPSGPGALPRRNHRSTELAARAQRLHTELAATGEATPTWREVAELLGVKYSTLDGARTRARHYAQRETA